MRKSWLSTHRDEGGATAVIVALSLVALFGMLVLVVDVGGLLYKRRELVNGSDAGALAAAQTCADDNPTVAAAEAQSDTAAIGNVRGLNATDGQIIAGSETCGQPRGYVTVRYAQQQQLFFAGVLGFGNTNGVTTEATAAWGALGGGNAVPIVLESGQFQGPCDIPDGVDIGDLCNFWYNNGPFAIGDANWGFLSLDDDGWDVAADANCPSWGANERGDAILYSNISVSLTTNPTYVCRVPGHATSNWQDLVDRMNGGYANWPGKILLMPVNDCDAQVDRNGVVVPCGTGTPHKFAIVGFTALQIDNVLRGNDPAAIGTPGTAAQNGTCGNNGAALALNVFGFRDLAVVADNDCGAPLATTISSIPFSSVLVRSGNGANAITYVKCPPVGGLNCDYRYNESATQTLGGIAPFGLQWVNPLNEGGATKRVRLNWTVNATAGTEGACGIRSSDPNALCLVTSWQGYFPVGSIVGTGPDFGARAFVLCDFTYNSCPANVRP